MDPEEEPQSLESEEPQHLEAELHPQNNVEEFTQVLVQQPDSLDSEYSQDQIEKVEKQAISEAKQIHSLGTFQHESAIQIIFKIVERNYSRHFLKRLTFAYIQSLKSQTRTIVVTAPHPLQKWPYQDLYQKNNRSQDEQQMFEFVNLCAQMIQSNFKGFITRKRHKIALERSKKAHQRLIAFTRMWKTWRVYNCRKCFIQRAQIRRIDQQRDQEENNFTTRDPKKIKQLYKHYQLKTRMFRDAFCLLMETGMWTLEDNMIQKKKQPRKPMNRPLPQARPLLESRPQLQADVPQRHPQRQKKIQKHQNVKENFNNSNKGELESQTIQERPIKAKGQYVINQNQIQLPPQPPQNSSNDFREKQEQQNPAKKEEIKRDMKKREKRQKYDPRKAIQEEKKRKKQQAEKEQSKTVQEEKKSVPTKTEVKNQRIKTDNSVQEIPVQETDLSENKSATLIQNEGKKKVVVAKAVKNPKKVASKVNCWTNQKEEEAEWVKQCKARLQEQTRRKQQQEHFQTSMEKAQERSKEKIVENVGQKWGRRPYEPERSVQKVDKFHSIKNWQQQEIQNLKEKQNEITVNRKSSTHNLQQQVKNIVERNMAKKRQSHRSIDELQDAHNKHYGDRFQNLMPKLSLLAVARDKQCESGIPVIDTECQQFGEWFHAIFNSTQFWNLASQLQRVYKSFVLH